MNSLFYLRAALFILAVTLAACDSGNLAVFVATKVAAIVLTALTFVSTQKRNPTAR